MAGEVIGRVDSIQQGSLARNGGSAVCQVIWLGEDPPFNSRAGAPRVLLLTAPMAELPPNIAERPGGYHAVIALRDLTTELTYGATLQLGDAVVRICNHASPDHAGFNVKEAELLEEGLVEPGAPVILLD